VNERTVGEEHGVRTWLRVIAGAALVAGMGLAGCESGDEVADAEPQAEPQVEARVVDRGNIVPVHDRSPQGRESTMAIPSGQDVYYDGDGRLPKTVATPDHLTLGAEAQIELRGGTNGNGRIIGVTDDIPKVIIFPVDEGWEDNAGSSLNLRNVKAGTVIRLFDNPGIAMQHDEYGELIGYAEDPRRLRLSEDWVEIHVKHSVADYTIRNLESQFYDKYVTIVWYRDSHINGRVSRLEVSQFDESLLPLRPTGSLMYLQPESMRPVLAD
jgi:hypothetical protein